ncbi:thiamine pyrophosphokinase 1-like [Glandiceps talaboti]
MAEMAWKASTSRRTRPLGIFEPTTDLKLALIILNRPVGDLKTKLDILWKKAVFHACADGGVNQLYNNCEGKPENFIPELLSGDEDSWTRPLTEYYSSKGSEVIATPNQDETDFTKCLRLVCEKIKILFLQVDCIVVIGAFGGRMDHVMANINTLYIATELTDVPVYLVGEKNLMCLLNTGQHTLEVDTGLESHSCGLVPLGEPCHNVTTTGLKWNLSNSEMRMGGLISTSNTYDPNCKDGIVTIATDKPLIWTMDYK